jgi:hypothetical protein
MTQQKDYYTTAKATPDSLLVGERERERTGTFNFIYS